MDDMHTSRPNRTAASTTSPAFPLKLPDSPYRTWADLYGVLPSATAKLLPGASRGSNFDGLA